MNDHEQKPGLKEEITRLERELAEANAKIAAFEAEMAAMSGTQEQPVSAEEIATRDLIGQGVNRPAAKQLLARKSHQ